MRINHKTVRLLVFHELFSVKTTSSETFRELVQPRFFSMECSFLGQIHELKRQPQSINQSITQSLTHSLTHSLNHSLTHSLTHSHTHTHTLRVRNENLARIK
jgi:hypothetical protein